MAEAIVSMVVGRITDLLIEEPQLLHQVRDEIQQVVTELMRIKTFLRDAYSRLYEEKVRNLLVEVRDLAYDAEHVVESFLVKALSSPGKTIQWRKFSTKIKDIQRKMSLLSNRFHECRIKSTSETPESSDSSYGTRGKQKQFHSFTSFTTVEPEFFVGFHGDVDSLVGHLVDESDDSYPLISICGMGGLGKTTLARKIYTHSTIRTNFSGLAWVSISRQWQPKLVLQRILVCLVHERKEEILEMDYDKLVENLLQVQQKKKCLIVLDDIWSTDAWDSIKKAFTAEKSISKLLLTSRNVDVAHQVNPKGLIHQPGLLTADQSWELLWLKALSTRRDSLVLDEKRMEELGREMVSNCAGLPLAIVTLGGVLACRPLLIEWEKVRDDIMSSLEMGKGSEQDHQSQILNVLGLSYKELPLQLKPCFLYLGKFMEDECIDAENLYQLWIAEGMVLSGDKREGETMMQVAESYLGELVHRSMVQVTFNDLELSLSKFKSCSLHDLMRDLSLFQAKAEDFFETTYLREENDFHLNRSEVSRVANTRQLVVYYESLGGLNVHSHFIKKPNHQQYRSILLFDMNGYYNHLPLGSYIAKFKLLRVLALENGWHRGESVLGTLFGTEISSVLGSLVYLRYLSLRGSNLDTFPWIHKLVLLQTLNLNVQTIFNKSPVQSSTALGKLAHLRHLWLPNFSYWREYPNSRMNFKLRFDELSKLETLENFNIEWCEVKDLPKLSSLRRLKLKAEGRYDVKEMFKYLSGLALLSNSSLRYLALEIKISYPGFKNDPHIIRQLFWNRKFNLRELSITGDLPELSEIYEERQQLNHTHIDASFTDITNLALIGSYLKEDPMPVLEKIPTLRVLNLEDNAYQGKKMVCSAMGFPKLTRLVLALYNLEEWRVEEGSMPILQHLQIDNCRTLGELPEGLKFLNSLVELNLMHMPSYFSNRIRLENGEQGPDFYKKTSSLESSTGQGGDDNDQAASQLKILTDEEKIEQMTNSLKPEKVDINQESPETKLTNQVVEPMSRCNDN